MMLTSSGPANISGNRVCTSIFKLPWQRGEGSARRLYLNNLQAAAQTFSGAAGREQRANRVDRHALPADDPPHIRGIKAQFVNRQSIAIHWRHGRLVWM